MKRATWRLQNACALPELPSSFANSLIVTQNPRAHFLASAENISLPAAYHGRPTLEQVAALAREVLGAFGADAAVFFARLPEELGVLERKIASFVRGLVAAPQIMIFDALEEGLSVAECRHAARFEAEYRARTPHGTLVYVDTREEA